MRGDKCPFDHSKQRHGAAAGCVAVPDLAPIIEDEAALREWILDTGAHFAMCPTDQLGAVPTEMISDSLQAWVEHNDRTTQFR